MSKQLKLLFTLILLSTSTFAESTPVSSKPAKAEQYNVINIAGHTVPVVAEGLYDRFRSNPPLDVINEESPDIDLSWFRTLKKKRVDIGFDSYSPNFYYENSRVSIIFTADIERLRELMPEAVLDQVQPISVWPGRGLIALTAYSYQYCDNDSYKEITISIVTTKPRSLNLGPISLARETMSKDYWGYVLKLPVDTELARVRGLVGYNLPKWLTEINYKETDSSIVVEIADVKTGAVDVSLTTNKLDDISTDVGFVKNNFINLDHQGQLSTGYSVSRQLAHASSFSSDDVNLRLGDGSLSTFIKSLNLGRVIKYEYIPSFQSALYAPNALDPKIDTE